ncbi:TlpA disulfide reductase family protein [Clostridium rectalis]|uniref:TlpA disulfide reductase family protein n=1 Tax=Clostridium rectalis TaxID=2040295 RepID=UPI000F6362C4|nr:redoxin domain-containing protein [Clostridium rectalis]
MKRKVLFIVLIALLIIGIGGAKLYTYKQNNKNFSIKNKDEVKKTQSIDFTLEDVFGNKITLSNLKGKKVYLNFWATWCGYCKEELDDIQTLHNEYKNKNIVILAINVGEDKKTVKKYLDESRYNFTTILDIDGKITELYGIQGFPTSLFIDEQGYVYNGVQGLMNLNMMKEKLDIK